MFGAWEDIYSNDDERKMSFELSSEFALNVKKVYISLGYDITNVPYVSIDKRVDFILKSISEFA